MKCPNCGAELTDGMKFCDECGTKIPQVKKCISCGAEIPFTKKFCSECGAKQDGKAGSGISLGDKNVVAGDIISNTSTVDNSNTVNNTTVINHDETKHTAKCHICGKIVLRIEGYDCPKCGQFTCVSCYDESAGVCSECSNEKENVYKQAVKRSIEDDGIIDMSARKELMSLQQQLGLETKRAMELEKIVKAEMAQGKSAGENEIGNFDKINLEKARTVLYDNLNFEEAVKLLEPLYKKYKLNEEVLTDYLYALSFTDAAKIKELIQNIQADALCLYLAQIDMAAGDEDWSQVEDLLNKAERIWNDSVLVKCRRVEFNIKLAETSGDTSYVMLANDLLNSCGEGTTKLERTWLLKTKRNVEVTLGNEVKEMTDEDIKTLNVYKGFFIFDEDLEEKFSFEQLMKLNAQVHDEKIICAIGACYEDGQGVPQDYAKALEWYRKAADQGHESAQDALKRLNG